VKRLALFKAGEVGGVEEGEEDAAKGGIAAGRVVPLLKRVNAAADASGTDGDSGDAEGERDVGVSRAETGFGALVEVAIDGTESSEECCAVGKGAAGPIADRFDGEAG